MLFSLKPEYIFKFFILLNIEVVSAIIVTPNIDTKNINVSREYIIVTTNLII